MHTQAMSVAKDITDGIKRLVTNQSEASKKSHVSQPTISRYKEGDLGATNLLRILDYLGAKVLFPDDDPTREVVFVNPRLHEDYKSLPHPIPDDYRAIPLTNMEVAAGPSPARGFSTPAIPRAFLCPTYVLKMSCP